MNNIIQNRAYGLAFVEIEIAIDSRSTYRLITSRSCFSVTQLNKILKRDRLCFKPSRSGDHASNPSLKLFTRFSLRNPVNTFLKRRVMRFPVLLLLPLSAYCFDVEKAPVARALTLPDSDLLKPISHVKRKRTKKELETGGMNDDYNDFESTSLKNRDNAVLKSVTYAPITQTYDIPKFPEASTLSPGPSHFTVNKNTQLYTWYRPETLRRKGYYFMHYPWNLLPKPYRIRPSYQFIYPTEFQNTVYSYPTNPYRDYYGVYRQLIPCGSTGGYCGHQGSQYGGCEGGGGCGGGCGSGSDGCGDTTGYSGDEEEAEEETEETTEGGKSGETHVSTSLNKKDPLEDLNLEDLEKLDKDKSDEKEIEKVDVENREEAEKKHH